MRLVRDLRRAISDQDARLAHDLLEQIDAALEAGEDAVNAVATGRDAYPAIARMRKAIDCWPTEQKVIGR